MSRLFFIFTSDKARDFCHKCIVRIAITMTHTESIQQLYLAYFQRPAETAGLHYWTYALDNGVSLASIREQFAKAGEYQTLVAGKSNEQVVDSLYLNLFGRHADAAGLTFYKNALDHGDATVSFVVDDIIKGATGSDAATAYNKVVAAELFTTGLGVEADAGVGYLYDSSKGKTFLATVTDDASLYTALGKLPDYMEIIVTSDAGVRAATDRAALQMVVIDSNALTVPAAVEQLYLAYFKRPADLPGLNFWSQTVATGTTDLASKALAHSAEYLDSIKGLGNEQIIDNVYLNLFGHHADSAGLKFYSDAMTAGQVTIDLVVRSILAGAQAQDREVLDNRTVAAELFTTALNIEDVLTPAYAAHPEAGSIYIDPITNDASVYSAVRGLPSLLHDMTAIVGVAPPMGEG